MKSLNLSLKIIETGRIRKNWDDYVQIWMMILYHHSHVPSPLQPLEPTLLSWEFVNYLNHAKRG